MRLLHVVPSYLPATRYGGPIYSVHGLCKALVGLGHEVHVVTTSVDGAADSPVPLDHSVDVDGVHVRYFASRWLRRLYYAPSMHRRLAREIASFDLVHLHSVFLWPTSMAARLAARARVPYVVSPRGMLVAELITRRSRWLKTAWLSLIESETLARAAAVHLTSEQELRDARALALPLPAPFVVPNGVDAPGPDRVCHPSARVTAMRARGPYALYLGRIHWKKGLENAVSALRGNEVRLVLVGPDEERYGAQIERVAREQGVDARIEIAPAVDGDDKWSLLSGARFVILPSINENFGNTILEAMAMGRPAIATDAVGASSLLASSGAGLVCAGTPEALAMAMRTLWEDRELAEQLGRAGARAAAELSWPAVAARMAAHYQRFIRALPPSRSTHSPGIC